MLSDVESLKVIFHGQLTVGKRVPIELRLGLYDVTYPLGMVLTSYWKQNLPNEVWVDHRLCRSESRLHFYVVEDTTKETILDMIRMFVGVEVKESTE